MLQRQEPEEQIPLPERRVTTEEFTQAVTALEARKEAERQRLAETVPIAETVQELGIDAQPDEIWAEVQTQRARQAAASAKPPQSQETGPQQIPASRHIRPFQYVYQESPRRQRRFRWFPIIIAVFIFTRVIGLNVHHPSEIVSPSMPVVLSPANETVADLQDGTVFVNDKTLRQLKNGYLWSQVRVHEEEGDNDWVLQKYDGHLYLRGYTLPLSDHAIQSHPIRFFRDFYGKNDKEMPISIRLDKFEWPGEGGVNRTDNQNEITITHVHLDSFAHAVWSP